MNKIPVWLVSYALIFIVALALLTYVVLSKLMFDVEIADCVTVLLSVASFIAGRYHAKATTSTTRSEGTP